MNYDERDVTESNLEGRGGDQRELPHNWKKSSKDRSLLSLRALFSERQ